MRINEGRVYLDLEATGTEDEGLLRSLTGKEGRRISIHKFLPDCTNVLSDKFLVHGRAFEEVDVRKVPWFSNLTQVRRAEVVELDEMKKMRAEVEKRRQAAEGRPEDPPRKRRRSQKRRREPRKRSAGGLQKRTRMWLPGNWSCQLSSRALS